MYLTRREKELEKAQERGKRDYSYRPCSAPDEYKYDKGLLAAWKAGYDECMRDEVEFFSGKWAY